MVLVPMILRKHITLVIIIVCFTEAECQVSTDGYRAKISEFGIEVLSDYRTSGDSDLYGSADSEVEVERLIRTKLAIPVIITDSHLFGVQLKYNQHQFEFDGPVAGNNLLYETLEETRFNNIGGRLVYQRNFNSASLRFIGGAELKSDQQQWDRNSSKYFVAGFYRKQLSDNRRIGGGLVINQSLGRFSAYPIFQYEHSFSPRWTLDLVLPKSASIRRKLNNKTYLIGKAELKGWRYNLSDENNPGDQDLTIRKTDLQLIVSFEREIHDFLWFGVDFGYNRNFNYFLTEPGGGRRDAVVDLNVNDAKFLKFSMFIVPPRKLLN